MADHVPALAELLASADDLPRRLRAAPAAAALGYLRSLLLAAIEPGGCAGWTPPQLHSVAALVRLVVLATRSLQVELVDEVVVEVLELGLELACSLLDRVEVEGCDWSLQDSMFRILESALVAGNDKDCDFSKLCVEGNLLSTLPVLPVAQDFPNEEKKWVRYTHLGVDSFEEMKPADQVLITLASGSLQPDTAVWSREDIFQDFNILASLMQHFAVVKVGCMSRLINICAKLSRGLEFSGYKTDGSILRHMFSFITRVLKLLGHLANNLAYVVCDRELFGSVCHFADALPNLFKVRIELISHEFGLSSDNGCENLLVLVLDGLLQFSQMIFCNKFMFQNLQICVFANLLDILHDKIWRYGNSTSNLKPPLVYAPCIVFCLLKLAEDARKWTSQIHTIDEKVDLNTLIDLGYELKDDSLFCNVHSGKIYLRRKYACEEYIKMIFPPSSLWIDNLMHLVHYLHSEGIVSKMKLDRLQKSCARTVSSLDTESVLSHEEDALFGNLFSEAGRNVGSGDGLDQTSVASSCHSYPLNLPLKAASELLAFMKINMFCPGWHTSIYEDACSKLKNSHVDVLVSLLLCQTCLSDDKVSDGLESLSSHKRVPHINLVCFELLHSLFVRRVMSSSLEQHLVEEILKVENGAFTYNDETLALLAHAVICTPGTPGKQLRTMMHESFVLFIIEKAKSVSSDSPCFKDFLSALPSIMYDEIFLVAFHLSTEAEKTTLAAYVYSSLKSVASLGSGVIGLKFTSLSVLVLKLLLLLHHMILYSNTCPSWLLISLKTRLRNATCRSTVSVALHDAFSPGILEILESIMGDSVKELSHFLSQLAIFVNAPVIWKDDGILGLEWNDLCSTLSLLLDSWKGKKVGVVEDVILERYVFKTCWEILGLSSASNDVLHRGRKIENVNIENVESFIHFRHSVLCFDKECLPDAVVSIVNQLSSASSNTEVHGWNRLRYGSWLSLLLSVLNAGMQELAAHDISPGSECIADHVPRDADFLAFAEGLVALLFDSGRVPWLFKSLSLLLRMQLEGLQTAFTRTVAHVKCSQDSALLLLKHIVFEGRKQNELLENWRSSILISDSIYNLLPKLMEVFDKEEKGVVTRIYTNSFIHGFPSHLEPASAALISFMVTIKDIMYTLDHFLKLKAAEKLLTFVDREVLDEILELVMMVKSDKIFGHIHGMCSYIYDNLISLKDGLQDYSFIFVWSHLEGFLKDLNSSEVVDTTIHEWIVMNVVDFIDELRKDPAKFRIFKIYVNAEENNLEFGMNPFSQQHGNLLVLLDALDKCFSEAVNVRVLDIFVDLLSSDNNAGLKEKVQEKFLRMDLQSTSEWLGIRMLGFMENASGNTISVKASPVSLRESTVAFLSSLLSPSSNMPSRALRGRFIEALLVRLNEAFVTYDILTAKAFFNFIVQLSNGDISMKQLLRKTVTLMGDLANDDEKLQGLKFLFGFLTTFLSSLGISKDFMAKLSGKHLVCSRSGSLASRTGSSKKSSESLVLQANSGTGSTSLDCDATSADDDDDDGTSDGELASIDKDDEDDSNSERALASKVCTFTSSGSNFMEQHWYFCYTCDLTVSKGCCSVCAKVCHRGHRVVYSRSSRFFCDCGAGGVRGSSCQCLKPRKFSGGSTTVARGAREFSSLLPLSDDMEQVHCSDSDLDDEIFPDGDNMINLSIPIEVRDVLPSLLEDIDVEGQTLDICTKLLPTIIRKRDSCILKEKKVELGDSKILFDNVEFLQLKKTFKSGSLDMKIKADYHNSRELKSHLSNGVLIKSVLSISTRGRIAAGEGDKVSIFDAGQLIAQPSGTAATAEKSNLKPLSRNIVRYEVVHLLFNPVVENYLAVAGFEECQILSVNHRGEVTDRLAIELALQGAYIRRVEWVPGSQVQLMVVTNIFVKIYDLSQDNISPIHYFTVPDDVIADASLILAPQGRLYLLVLSNLGTVFRLELLLGGEVSAKPLKDILLVPGKDLPSKGLSLYFSSTFRLLFLSYKDGTTLIGRLNQDATTLTEVSFIFEGEKDALQPVGLHHWKELHGNSGLFVCCSSVKSNAALAVSLGPNELASQNIRNIAGSASPSVGMTSYKPLSKDKVHFFVLHEDGSLHIFVHVPAGVENVNTITSDQAKKIGSAILSGRAYAGLNPEFPLDFFEKTMCITADVKLNGDGIRNNDSEGIKHSLASEDGFLESPNPAGFKVTVSNMNPDIVMVGIRVHVGNSSASHIPSNISIFQRVIKLDEGMRSWYDIPFSVAESLLADEEFTINIGPTFNGAALPRLDSLEIYGRAKDEFGWKEKMDTILDEETSTLVTSSGILGSGKNNFSIQTAPLQEQVVADGFKLLSKIYLLRMSDGSQESEDANIKLKNLRCRKLLEVVFESDREPLLQSAACRVLQSVFMKKEMYYQVKDTIRLLGVINSSPVLAARLGVGGATAAWVIKEFTVQVRAVSKIALHRRESMAIFLETHGSRVVDGLMQVLWGILDLEQPDTQTINNIVIPSVELIYSYAECLALHGSDKVGRSVKPAVILLRKLLFAPYEAVQHTSSLAISSRLLQVPFPKQTMLSSDDIVENTVAAPTTSERTGMSGGSNQVMIEEDTATSSVQYCCDGCSTVPILRRRWHCNVCPDFDLCEACYEIMDADRLPPPHSRDHPMSAIPIEVDLIGGDGNDGNDMHFSLSEMDESNMLHASPDLCIQSSSPSLQVPEQNETSGDFPFMVDQRIVSISASKRVVKSLLLRELVSELRGWMEETSGVRAIPVMQFFYRLSSAVGGPFMDGATSENLDLEKFVKWFLDEINLKKPFPVKTRSTIGEVVILVFMFFILMLRNWHQPGGESSLIGKSGEAHDKACTQVPSSSFTHSINGQEKSEFASQLVRACGILRQQTFVNYLMDILQQLVVVFKASPENMDVAHGFSPGVGCGALLTVRKELPAGNFSPFFSDSYAKAHRPDIFSEYHRLLLENTFRLVYSLVRPEKSDKSEKDKQEKSVHKSSSVKDLKLDGYQDILCSYINNPLTSYIRRYARRLFLHLCGNKTHYYSVRDSWQFSNELKRLRKVADKSGGFQIPLSYERSVKLVKNLSAISEVASARPRNWQKYCHKHGDVLCFLMNVIFYFGEESLIQTLKLLNLAFYTGKDVVQTVQKSESGDTGTSSNKGSLPSDTKKKKRSDDTESGVEKNFLDMEQAVEIFNDKDGYLLRRFANCFLLEWNSAAVRLETKCVLYGVWCHAKQPFKEAMLKALLEKIKYFPVYGQNIVEYTELLVLLLGRPDASLKHAETELVSKCMTPDVINCIFDTLYSQNELLANHPNSRIYNTLSGLVEFDGYYLESEPCVACSCPEVPFAKMKLESLKSESKFTDNRIIVKCTGSYTIQAVTMTVHDARKSKSVKLLNLYYNNRPVHDLSELKNSWSSWKRAKSCHLSFNQTELKVEFPIPITACNFMIGLDSFYENLQASSLESLQCPRCSRSVTDKHGICGNCHENAYQCRQCRNINYENLDSFLCNECGYSKYGRFEFNFMAKPSFLFDDMENDDDMRKGLAAIESESENAHRRYQQLLGFKKPLLKLVSSIGENEIDSQQKDTVQQMMATISGPSCKINRKIALLGVLYGEKCKGAFDSVSKSVQTLQGLRRVLMNYLHQKQSNNASSSSALALSRSPNNCYGCATMFINQCLELLLVLSKYSHCKKQLADAGILTELFENNIHQGSKSARIQTRGVLCAFSEGDPTAVAELNRLIHKKVMYCLEHHRSMDIANATSEELLLLSEICSVADEFWEARLRIVFQLLFSSIKLGSKHPAISEHVILPCLRIITQACTLPKTDSVSKDHSTSKQAASLPKDDNLADSSVSLCTHTNVGKPIPETSEKHWESTQRTQDMQLLSYLEWEKGSSYIDFVRRQYKVSQAVKTTLQRSRFDPQRQDYLALKYAVKWKHYTCRRTAKNDFSAFELGSWISELILSLCSQSIRSETSLLVNLLCAKSSSRRFKLLKLLMGLLPATLSAGECSAEYFDLLFKMIETEDARLFSTAKGFLSEICKLMTKEVGRIESLERSLRVDISQGFVLHKLIELLSKFLEIANIRSRFIRDNMLSEVLEALLVIRGVIIQKTKLISDCNKLLKDILDGLILECSENKRHFIRACVSGLQKRSVERKGRTSLFILEQLCNLICPSKPEPVYFLILNKAHTQEEFIRGSMTKNPYSSSEIGPLMRDVKNKICHQLDLLGLVEDDYGMELLVAGNIISLDLSIPQVYEQVWKKSPSQTSNIAGATNGLSSAGFSSTRDCPPMTVTYRLQGLDGEATEPMIKELEEEREEFQDPEVEFAIAGAVREYGGLEIILHMIQLWEDKKLKSNPEELHSVLNLLVHCCKIRENRRALLRLGALGLLLETARRAFSVDAMESAEGILLIVENLTTEANESDIGITQSVLKVADEEAGAGEQAKKIVLMFLERLSHPSGHKKSSKQQRNYEMVARILPYLTYGQPSAMEALIQYFDPYLRDWFEFDKVQKQHEENAKDEQLIQLAGEQRLAVENFVRVSESLKASFCSEKLKDIVLEKGFVESAVRHLREVFPWAGQAGYKSTAEWNSGLKLPSVPLILSMLRGLSIGHIATQKCIDDGGLLPLLHALEGVPGENEIGAKAENLLDTLSDEVGKGDGFLVEKVNALRHATRDEMRRRALRKRQELLQGLGMRQVISDVGERIVVSQPSIEGLDEVEEEEEGLACMVCREGYTLRPNDMMGVYSFSKRVNLGMGASGNARGECVYTTVSHFNIIHYQCHQEAKRADAALKNPKKEWEGATLRNNETLCNCLFPVKGPAVPLADYVRCIDQYWDSLGSLGRADGGRLRLLTFDIVLMLARFATGASFSADCKGGGRESNARFLPFMIQMARHLLDQGGSGQRKAMVRSVSTYLSATFPSETKLSGSPGSRTSVGTEETVQFMMINSLLCESYDEWLLHHRAFLLRGIHHAYMQHNHGRSSLSSPTSRAEGSSSNPKESSIFSIVMPMLVYTGLIEQLQKFLKGNRSSSSGAAKSSSAGELDGYEKWEVVMKERLLNVKEMVEFAQELLSWLEYMTSASNLQEAFDVMGTLGDALSGGFSQCEDFVQAALEGLRE